VNYIILKSSRLLLCTLLQEDIHAIIELQKENYNFSIILRNSNSFIGYCGLEIIDIKLQAKIFYALLSNFWGNGYGYEAIKQLIKFAFEELSLNKITAHISDGNARGWKVIEKEGLKYMGQIDVINNKLMLFCINKKEYLNQNWY
jgi:ribosomal-protein-alanine N-acetyltransferase